MHKCKYYKGNWCLGGVFIVQEARKVLGRPFLPVPQGQSVYFNILKLLSEGLEKLTSEEILSL